MSGVRIPLGAPQKKRTVKFIFTVLFLMSGAHGRQELPCNSRVGMSPIGSYVGGLTSKGQASVLPKEHRGWILRMAALIKGRLSDNQTSDRKPVGLPFRLQRENISMISFNKRMFHIPLAKQEALHSLEPKACRPEFRRNLPTCESQ